MKISPLRLFFAIVVVGILVPSCFLLAFVRTNSPGEDVLWMSSRGFLKKTNKVSRTKEEFCESPETVKDPVIQAEMLRNVIVNDQYKMLYCQVPKIACTNWKRVFLVLSNQVKETDPMQLRAADVHGVLDSKLTYLSDLSPEQIKHRLTHYYKFMFTREPFERILSAYRNKFITKNEFFRMHFGRKIIKSFRANPSENAFSTGNDVTFLEFIQYLVDPYRVEPLNEHWQKMTEMCHPCLIKYDFIGKYDNIDQDAAKILKDVGASAKVQFPTRKAAYKLKGTKEFLRQFYSKIPPVFLNQLWNLFYSDFLMYDFDIPPSLKNLTSWRHVIRNPLI